LHSTPSSQKVEDFFENLFPHRISKPYIKWQQNCYHLGHAHGYHDGVIDGRKLKHGKVGWP